MSVLTLSLVRFTSIVSSHVRTDECECSRSLVLPMHITFLSHYAQYIWNVQSFWGAKLGNAAGTFTRHLLQEPIGVSGNHKCSLWRWMPHPIRCSPHLLSRRRAWKSPPTQVRTSYPMRLSILVWDRRQEFYRSPTLDVKMFL